MTHLVWFRNDLRLSDNPALTAACKSGGPVRACFVVTPEQWRQHDWSPARTRFVIEHANALSRELASLGIPMDFLEAGNFCQTAATLPDYCREHGVRDVHANEEYGINERRRDKQTAQRLEQIGTRMHSYRDQTIAPVGSVLTRQSEPYSVFTPFSRSWHDWIETANPYPWPAPGPIADAIPANQYKGDIPGLNAAPEPLVPTGEQAAHQQLESFLEEQARHYHEQRDFPALDGTSLLSPYLANGVLSGRQCLLAARQMQRAGGQPQGMATWINELAWRDFYIHILYHYPRVSMHRAFKPDTERLVWNPPGEAFEAWKTGQTGIPLVDAGMRQLNTTGWMHNRLRMVTAMFLTKNLFIDWRLGEQYFMSRLVDGFLASNNGGWQWSASTGTDAAPYFRVFNPATQSERFDPRGDFIRQWIPELGALDNRRIHYPFTGGPLPKGYPEPIVDLKASRKEAIARFQALKDQDQAVSVLDRRDNPDRG